MAERVRYLLDNMTLEEKIAQVSGIWVTDLLDGQRQFVEAKARERIGNGALGVVYWEPAWVSTPCSTRWGQGSHWENAIFFDFQNDNEVLEGIDFLSHDYLYPERLVDGVIEEAYGHS